MFTIDTDKTISVTRGDSGSFVVPVNYAFQESDVLRLKVFRKKTCEDVVLQRDFKLDGTCEAVTIDGTTTSLFLTEEETRKISTKIISKPVDYWYEIELNPESNPQTIVGYDGDGPKIFRLYPEGRDLEDDELNEEEADTLRKLMSEFKDDVVVELQGDIDSISVLVGGAD